MSIKIICRKIILMNAGVPVNDVEPFASVAKYRIDRIVAPCLSTTRAISNLIVNFPNPNPSFAGIHNDRYIS